MIVRLFRMRDAGVIRIQLHDDNNDDDDGDNGDHTKVSHSIFTNNNTHTHTSEIHYAGGNIVCKCDTNVVVCSTALQ